MAKQEAAKAEPKAPKTFEENNARVVIEARQFDPVTGVRLSNAFGQYFDPLQFKRWYEARRSTGYYLNEILHLPDGLNPKDFPVDPDPRNGQ